MIRRLVQVLENQLIDGGAPADSVLSVQAQKVEVFDDSLAELVRDLMETLLAHPIAIGLAAPQIGDRRQVAVVNVGRKSGEELVLINPEVQSMSGKKDRKRESCMSVPGVAGTVERRSKAQVSYQGTNGQRTTQGFEGFVARVVQHEIDHLDGVLYSSHTAAIGEALQPTDIFDYEDPTKGGSEMS